MLNKLKDCYTGALLGLACGDAVGTTAEFKSRGSFSAVTDMLGGGPFQLQAGEWTDDTSMALCLGYSLCESHGFNAIDQMNRYCNWWQYGYMSSTGECFDIGMTTMRALKRYQQNGQPFAGDTDPYSAGNGSLMRLAPIVLYYYPNREELIFFAGESSRTTHAAQTCIEACQAYALILQNALDGKEKHALLDLSPWKAMNDEIQAMMQGDFIHKERSRIKGSGYVVESLEAALWCFFNTGSFEEAILMATNLGDDADTTAAICGQLAGAFYGKQGIPNTWLNKLAMRGEIEQLALRLLTKK